MWHGHSHCVAREPCSPPGTLPFDAMRCITATTAPQWRLRRCVLVGGAYSGSRNCSSQCAVTPLGLGKGSRWNWRYTGAPSWVRSGKVT